MSRKVKAAFLALIVIIFLVIAAVYLKNANIAVLQPQGQIGRKERHLILLAIGLSMIIVIPVYFMLFAFAWRYREGNKKARYDPTLSGSRLIEGVWWAVPLIIISILAVATWRSSHDLDPFKPLSSNTPPVTIQVVALEWKWLFIYPQQSIATINFVQFPQNTPIDFEITADAPMNSFWIPQLGGQIYAMSGMSTHLHLMADRVGSYDGSSANISGEGFAGMRFIAHSSTKSAFDQWVKLAKQTKNNLTLSSYNRLVNPSKNNPIYYYSSVETSLYHEVISKFEQPSLTGGA